MLARRLIIVLVGAWTFNVLPSVPVAADETTAGPEETPNNSSLPADLRPPFRWLASRPMLVPRVTTSDTYYSLKDPSLVFHQGRWHLFCTVRGLNRSHQIEYLTFADLQQPDDIQRQFLDIHAGFYCAPQVFYFRPQQLWYLICQASDSSWSPEYGAAYATTREIADPNSWSRLAPMQRPKLQTQASLDFWVICDDQYAHLFYTSLDGRMWREQTRLADFPHGWSEPVQALEADVFEASHTYAVQGTSQYLTIIEAQHPAGGRYYKAYTAKELTGAWEPLADSVENSFASGSNIQFTGERWSDSVSHGELLRAGSDERLEINPSELRMIFQGALNSELQGRPYGQIPWRLGVLERASR